jgi:uncharacterized membrane protein YphA (DoxX/SURF4 family)
VARRRGADGGGWAAAAELWRSLFRIGMGVYWLYFAAQKWPAGIGLPPHGIEWMHGYMVQSAQTSPVPGLGQVMTRLVLPNWQLFATGQAVGETAVGVLLLIGLATRPAALLATLLALNVSLTVAFLEPDVGLRWTYYLAVLASFEVFVSGAGSLAVERIRAVPGWLRS